MSRPTFIIVDGQELPIQWPTMEPGETDIYVGAEIPAKYLFKLQPGSCWWGVGKTDEEALAKLHKEVERFQKTHTELMSDDRTSLIGNVFITLSAGTIVKTDDPKFPVAVLQEDVKVCSNAHAQVQVLPPPSSHPRGYRCHLKMGGFEFDMTGDPDAVRSALLQSLAAHERART